MKRLFLLSLIISFSLCSTMFAQQTISGSFDSGGETRSYIGAVPNTPQTPLRLVILFCGATEDASQMELRGFNDYLGSSTIVIYPEPFSAFGFDNSNGVDDYQMVEDLIAEVASNYTINLNDICIGGFSNGAIFTYNLVCDFNSPTSTRAYTFKSFAVVAGAMEAGQATITDCPIANDLPVIAFHGTQDPVVPYNGGVVPPPVNISSEAIEPTLDFWATTINGCNANPTITPLPDVVTETPTPSTVELLEYDCQNSQNTQLYRIDGGLHSWPGGNAGFDIAQSRNMDINASELIASFFEDQTTVSTSKVNLAPGSVSVYPNPVVGDLSIEATGDLRKVEIYNSTGNNVFSSTNPNSTIALDQLSPGIYFLKIETDAGFDVKKIIKE
jgi:polyhydroxybutyrate depolymerase